MFSIKPPIEPLRPTGGTGSKRHRGLPNVVVLRQAPVDRMPEEDFASCARNTKRLSTCRLTSSSPSSYKGKKRRRARREHYWSKKQIIQPQNLLIDCFSFLPRYDRNPTNGKPRCNHGMRGSCRFLADRKDARTVPLRKVRDSVKFYRREPLPNELEGKRRKYLPYAREQKLKLTPFGVGFNDRRQDLIGPVALFASMSVAVNGGVDLCC